MEKKLEYLIEKNNEKFTKNDHIIKAELLNNPNQVLNDDITSLASRIFVSKASVTRFCQKIGARGFKEVKYLIELSNNENDFDQNLVNFSSMVDFFHRDYVKMIEDLKYLINEKDIIEIVEYIVKARNIYVIGIGSSGFLASGFSYRLKRLGLSSQSISDPHFIKMNCELANEEDLFICVTRLAKTYCIKNSILTLRQKKIKSVLVTENNRSSLSSYASKTLFVPQKQNLALSDSISDQLGTIYVLDIIYHYLYVSNPERFIKNYDKTVINEKEL